MKEAQSNGQDGTDTATPAQTKKEWALGNPLASGVVLVVLIAGGHLALDFVLSESHELVDILGIPSPTEEEGSCEKSSLFRVGDFKMPASFVTRLKAPKRKSDPLSWDLAFHFSSPTRELLNEYKDSTPPSEALEDALIKELNERLQGPSLFMKHSFKKDGIDLRPETEQLKDQNPQGKDRIRLNRLLFEDVYQEEIRRSHQKWKPEFPLLQWSPVFSSPTSGNPSSSSKKESVSNEQKARLQTQFCETEKRERKHLQLTYLFFVKYFVATFLGVITAVAALIAMYFYSKEKGKNQAEVRAELLFLTALIVLGGAAAWYQYALGVFQLEKNMEANKVLYQRHVGLKNEILSFTATGEAQRLPCELKREGESEVNEIKKLTRFILCVDRRLDSMNNLAITLDPSKTPSVVTEFGP